MAKVTVKTTQQASKILSTYLVQFTNKVAQEIKAEAKANCPVDSGKLQRSIKVVKQGDNVYQIGSQLPYALWVEIGTRYMTARAYLRNAYQRVLANKL